MTSTIDTDIRMFLWFWEWNMFGAVHAGQHTHGDFRNMVHVADDGLSASIMTERGMNLSLRVGAQGVELDLHVKNLSDRHWSDLAAIIPCFSPGPEETRTQQFRTPKTSFVAATGFEQLQAREIHFNKNLLERTMDEQGADPFPWVDKWPTAATSATDGLMVRESSNGRWVTGIAWDRFLSAQGNNPWECMHLAVQVGPLAPGDTRSIGGQLFLFPGTKEHLLRRRSQASRPDATELTRSRHRSSPSKAGPG